MPIRHRTFTVALSLFAMMAAPTLAAGEVPDGDPCEVLVANTRAILPGAVLRARPIGVLLMEDEHGKDEKIVAVPAARLTRRYDAGTTTPTCRRSRASRSSTSSSTARTWSPASGRGSWAETARRPPAG